MDAAKKHGWSYDLLSRCRGELMGLAMLWVILFHAYALTVPLPGFSTFRSHGYLGVDIFILLSAMGLSVSLSRRKQRLGAFYLRRLLRVMPAYWLVTGAYGLVLRLAGQTSLTAAAWTMSTLFFWAGAPGYFNWYIPALLGFYLLTPLFAALFRHMPRRVRMPAALLLSCGAFFLSRLAMSAGRTDQCGFLDRIPVFLFGLLVGLDIAEARALSPLRLCLWASGVVLGPALKWALSSMGCYLSDCFSFALICVFLCLVLSWLLSLLPEGGFRKLLRWVGGCSLEIYLLNVIFEREYALFSRYLSFGSWQLFYFAVTIPLNVVLGILLHRLLEKPLGRLTKRVLDRPAQNER